MWYSYSHRIDVTITSQASLFHCLVSWCLLPLTWNKSPNLTAFCIHSLYFCCDNLYVMGNLNKYFLYSLRSVSHVFVQCFWGRIYCTGLCRKLQVPEIFISNFGNLHTNYCKSINLCYYIIFAIFACETNSLNSDCVKIFILIMIKKRTPIGLTKIKSSKKLEWAN